MHIYIYISTSIFHFKKKDLALNIVDVVNVNDVRVNTKKAIAYITKTQSIFFFLVLFIQ